MRLLLSRAREVHRVEFFVPNDPQPLHRGVARLVKRYPPTPGIKDDDRNPNLKKHVLEWFLHACWGPLRAAGVELPWPGPVRIWCWFCHPPLESSSWWEGKAKVSSPDTSNLFKLIEEALQGWAFGSDARAISIYGEKGRRVGPPGTVVQLDLCEDYPRPRKRRNGDG